MDVVGQVLSFLAVLLLLVTLLIGIPSRIGQEAGLWIVKKHFPAWPKVNIDKTFFWGAFDLGVAVALIILFAVAFGVPRIQIHEALMARRLQEVWDGMHYVFQIVITFFTASFVTTLFACWYNFIQMSKKSADMAQSKPPVTAVVMAKGVFYAYYLALMIVLGFSMVIRHTVGVMFLDSVLSYIFYVAFLISIFLGAAYVTKQSSAKGWLYGGIFGLIYLVGLLVVVFGIIIPTDFGFDVGRIAIKAFLAFITGAAGGILGQVKKTSSEIVK